MNNVVDLKERAAAMQSNPKTQHVLSSIQAACPNNSAIMFHAEEKDLYWRGGEPGPKGPSVIESPTHKVLCRKQGNAYNQLAVVGRGYKIVQNAELFDAINKQFARVLSERDVEGMTVHDTAAYNGRDCIREYRFPSMKCAPIGDVSDVAFRAVVINGFGGSSVQLISGALDYFCTNGMRHGEFDTSYHKHTKGLQIGDVTDRLKFSIELFYKSADIYGKWFKKNITNDQAHDFFKEVATSERLADKLMHQYLVEKHIRGSNVWALYSAMTYYASHDEGEFKMRDTGTNHQPMTMQKRGRQVNQWIANDAFEQLVA